MPNTNELKYIYVGSDALWDLRQGTLTRIDPEFAAMVTSQPSYYQRDQDVFGLENQPPLEKEIYQGVFERYKDEIVRCSLVTPIVEFIISLCTEYLKPNKAKPTSPKFGVQINLYPFSFTPQEKDEIVELISAALAGAFPVSLINQAPADISAEYAEANYLAMIMYDYSAWLNPHTDHIRKYPLMNVGIYAPRLLFGDKSTLSAEIRSQLEKHGMDEYDAQSLLLRNFVGIQHLPISFFCASTPVNSPIFRQLIKTA